MAIINANCFSGCPDLPIFASRSRQKQRWPTNDERGDNPMNTPDTFGGKAVLTLAHVVGMVDMVALPVWIGALMQHYRYSPPQAGITVTLFLFGVVIASGIFAPRFNRLPKRAAAAGGFTVAAIAFYLASLLPVEAASFQVLAGLHTLAGLGVGCALTFTHGCIGRSGNPHRLFAVVNIALGVFALAFLGGVPQVLQQTSAAMLFDIFAALMGLAAVVTAMAFPAVASGPIAASLRASPSRPERIPRAAWFVISVVVCLTLNQAMVFSFVERIGAERGFGTDRVNGVLIALGLVNLLPGALAALLQNRWSPVAVGIAGPVGQAALALTMSSALTFAPYAVAASVYVFMVIFTHNFLFGLLSRLDPSGRSAAATPAMMMVGSCIGPALGGVIVQGFGYAGLGWAACAVAAVAVLGMLTVRRHLPAPVALQAAHA
jgi:predicted MFS family arabinose efflux permease